MTPTRHPLSSQPLPSQWPGSSPPPVETPKSYPISTPPFSSSPSLSSVSTQTRLSASPDLFDELNYSESMDDDFRRIDVEVASIAGTEQLSYHVVFPQPNEGPLPAAQEERTWVVFNGKVPGIYDCCVLAAMQTQGYSDNFQRVYPSRESAEVVWRAFQQDGIFPDYGKGPWVVYVGNKPGVATKITELECSVKGYDGALFRSCFSVAEGKIKYRLFAERVAQMFSNGDPFSDVDTLILKREDTQSEPPVTQPISPALFHQKPPLAPRVPESWNAAADNVPGSSTAPYRNSARRTNGSGRPHRTEGYYVAFHAVLPGVYSSSESLKAAAPEPGGFTCVPDKKTADVLFHGMTLNGSIVWVCTREIEV